MTLTPDSAVRAGECALALLELDGTVRHEPISSCGDQPEGLTIDVSGDDWYEVVHLDGRENPAAVVAQVADQISEYISESPAFWGIAFPRCPRHKHPAEIAEVDTSVVLRCPASGAEIRRVRP